MGIAHAADSPAGCAFTQAGECKQGVELLLLTQNKKQKQKKVAMNSRRDYFTHIVNTFTFVCRQEFKSDVGMIWNVYGWGNALVNNLY